MLNKDIIKKSTAKLKPFGTEELRSFDTLLTQSEVSEMLKISTKQIKKLRDAGKLEAVKHPTQVGYSCRVYFRSSEIQRYIEEELLSN